MIKAISPQRVFFFQKEKDELIIKDPEKNGLKIYGCREFINNKDIIIWLKKCVFMI